MARRHWNRDRLKGNNHIPSPYTPTHADSQAQGFHGYASRMHYLCSILSLFIFILSSCSSSGDNPSTSTGSLSLSLLLPQSSLSSIAAAPQYKGISDRCAEFGISVVEARVFDEENELIARGGPWNCDAGKGTLTRVKHGANRSVRVNLNNDEGRLILTGKKSNITVIAGKVAEAVIEIDLLSSEEVLLDALNDNATVNRGGTLSVLDSGYASVLHNDLAPDRQSLYANTTPISGPRNGSLTIYADGTFRYTHNGGNETTDSFTYEAKDAHGGTDIATATISISAESNHAPVLNSGVVNPDTGDAYTTFTFGIRYTDQDSQSPTTRYVYIDGIPHPMTLSTGQNAWDGTYTYSTVLPAGPHAYYYSFSDGHGGSARLPASGSSSGLSVTGPENHAPVIDNGQISPTDGTGETTFTYSIHYSDQDNNTPAIASVYIDGAPHTMTLSSGSAWNGTYVYITTLLPGTHAYYFSFTDGQGGIAQAPITGTSSGPWVTGPPNHAPTIDNPGVTPVDGTTSTTYTYSVHYSDQDGNSASSAYVYIDGIAHTMMLTSGTASDGIYTFSTSLQAGTHAYYFSFADNNGGSARLPLIDAYAGPFVNHSPVLTNAAVNHVSGTTFTYSIYYSDQDGQAPSTRSVYIDGIPHDMSFASGQSLSNGIYAFETTLASGAHTYFFSFDDGHGGSTRLPETGASSGPLVNTPPNLSSPGVSPETGTAAATFTYSVRYRDLDGNSPATAYVYIDGIAHAMTLASGPASDGAYTFQTTLAPGAHTYYFSFTDGYGGSARLPVSGTLSGPSVNHPPVLENGKIDTDEGTTESIFTYSVHYSDQDGDIPASASVYIDGSAYTMVLLSGTASNGTYTFSTILTSEPHTYYFSFNDEHGDRARLPASGSYQGPFVSPANIIYVDKENGHVGNTGRSWALAVPGIQEAINAATPGDQIWVKQGVYLLTARIDVNKNLTLYGGFAGSEHYLSQRDFTNNTVYVDGQGLVGCFSLSGTASTVVIDGLCIRNGYSVSSPGGGISNIMASSLTIANCTFRDNHASQGGGINNSNNASRLMVINCLLENNTASTGLTGGGIYSMSADTAVSRSIFTGNTAGGGGGISCTGPKIRISNSLFNGNSAYTGLIDARGGGIEIRNSADAAITNCTVFGNQASYKGGGIYCESSTASIWNSIVWGNSWGVYNKQIYALSSTVTLGYSDVELGSYETPWGDHCIDENPGFIDQVNGDFHLSGVSPCINKGFNEAPCILDTDLEGNPRIIGNIVDMGAYEFRD